jgi:hypothetical protein
MAAVRALLNRVAKLEVSKVPPVLAMMGGEEGWAAFEADAEAGLADGRYDPRDTPVVIASLKRWLVVYA